MPFPPFLQFEEMNAELEENKELAQNRHCELEKLRQDFEEVTSQNEKLKVGDSALRGSEIKLFADHLTLMKRHISIIYEGREK